MTRAYRPRPQAFDENRKNLNDQKMVMLKASPARVPPSFRVDGFLSLLMGPALGQPGFGRSGGRGRWARRILAWALYAWVAFMACAALQTLFQ